MIIAQEATHKEVSFFRKLDTGDFEKTQSRYSSGRNILRTSFQFGVNPPMAFKFGGMDASMMKRLEKLEAEHARLNKVSEANRIRWRRRMTLP